MSDDDFIDEVEAHEEVAKLKRERDSLARQLYDHKHRKLDYIEAVQDATREAIEMITVRPVPKPRRAVKSDNAPEVAVALLSDLQTGKITPDYNSDVCRERVMKYAEKIVRITSIQRHDHPVDHCVVPMLGDMVEGVDIFPGQQWLLDSTLYRQVFESTPSIIMDFLRHLLANFETVTVEAVQGNHGRIGRKGMFGPEDNADRMVYKLVSMLMQDEPRLTFNMADPLGERAWYKVMEIGNYKAMLIHGDQIRGAMGFPWYGLCLPSEAEILTREGWKHYSELRPNQHVMTFDSETHENRWESIEAVNVFDWSGDLMEVNGIPATPGHNWPVETVDEGVRKMLTTAEININHKVPLHGEYLRNDASALTPRLAALLGWIVTDGHWRHRSTTPEAVITQSPNKFLDELVELTGSVPRGPFGKYDVYTVNVEVGDIRAIQAAGYSGKADLPGIVGLLSREAAEAMMDAMYKAEGNITGTQCRFSQIAGPVADTYQMLSVMCGSTVTAPRGADDTVRMAHRKGNYVYPARDGGMAAVPYEGKVWCPTTPSGTWWVRYRGRIMPTGNSKKVHSWASGGIPESFDDLMMGHYHQLCLAPMNKRTVWANGTTESTNTFASEMLAAQSDPSQWLLFCDPEAGKITASYAVRLLD